eukprot:TRINITY_DN15227_c0_g1_i1.p1 TRINITY_DN15227_c0_g1~~TRINITY_DN15227_c0_g1_i1.p1  ORF type:complete len:154 (+),score=27.41 TRINITY_DN15227_c0_g1_i1:29-490(+)
MSIENSKSLSKKSRKNVIINDVPNDGSLARDLLANERTFLAWVRTALSSIALGAALARIIPVFATQDGNPNITRLAEAAGLLLVILGLLIIVYGFWRYRLLDHRIRNGKFTLEFWGGLVIIVLSLVAGVLVLALVVLTLYLPPIPQIGVVDPT